MPKKENETPKNDYPGDKNDLPLKRIDLGDAGEEDGVGVAKWGWSE